MFIALGAVALLSSCNTRDTLEPIMDAHQEVPTAYWEVGGTACKAGESFTFQGKYRAPEGRTITHCQVWYDVKRTESAAATVKLAGAALSYTKTYTGTDSLRAATPIVTLGHDQAEWDGYEFIIKGEVPVSRTLSPVSWVEAAQWDQEKFDSFYPKGFAQEFCSEVINYLTKDSTYYASLRTVYINYPFTNEQVAAVNAKYGVDLPTNIDMSKDDKGVGEKSDLWYSTSEPDAKKIVGGYYFQLDAAGNNVVHEISKAAYDDYLAQSAAGTWKGASCYPVYESSPWVFCRYNDDLGAIVTTVRAKYMPAFKELLGVVTFPEWIYDSSNKVYKVEFKRNYSVDATFRVYDDDKQEGIAADVKTISIN